MPVDCMKLKPWTWESACLGYPLTIVAFGAAVFIAVLFVGLLACCSARTRAWLVAHHRAVVTLAGLFFNGVLCLYYAALLALVFPTNSSVWLMFLLYLSLFSLGAFSYHRARQQADEPMKKAVATS